VSPNPKHCILLCSVPYYLRIMCGQSGSIYERCVVRVVVSMNGVWSEWWYLCMICGQSGVIYEWCVVSCVIYEWCEVRVVVCMNGVSSK
jgi:hypothetical protein